MTPLKQCICITDAEEYNLDDLKTLFPDIQSYEHEKEAFYLELENGFVVIFKFGTLVFWDLSETERETIFKKINAYRINPHQACRETLSFKFGQKPKVINDTITLTKDKNLSLQLLTASYGLAQSLKLSIFESEILTMINQTRNIPEQLAEKGRFSMPNKEINKKIGALIMAKHNINIHSDILDSPNFLWENPELEGLYRETINDQDIPSRTHVVNTRLNILQDLFSLLGDELKNRHSFFIEVIIVLLISMEVIISLFTHFF